MTRIDGSVALVTGAAQGIGRAIALRLAADGADVALLDIAAEKLSQVAEEVQALGRRAITINASVTDREQVHAAVAVTHEKLGILRIVVNNAGIVQVKSIIDVTQHDFEHIVQVNLAGVLWGIQAAAKHFIDHGTNGTIINASSVAGHDGGALLAMYSATKFGVRALTQVAARELAPHGITVNAYCPGIADTDMSRAVAKLVADQTNSSVEQVYNRSIRGIALGRAGSPEDIAGLVSYLAGPDAQYMTGQAPLVDGGTTFR